MFSFQNSTQNIRIIGVPKKIGLWELTTVNVEVTYPNGTKVSKECRRIGSAYVATISGGYPGKTANGFKITASGKNEDGQITDPYILGVGDVVVLEGEVNCKPEFPTKTGNFGIDSIEGTFHGLSAIYYWEPSGKWVDSGRWYCPITGRYSNGEWLFHWQDTRTGLSAVDFKYGDTGYTFYSELSNLSSGN